jgi:hypothetical protein
MGAGCRGGMRHAVGRLHAGLPSEVDPVSGHGPQECG